MSRWWEGKRAETYLRIPVLVVDEGSTSDKPEDQLLVFLVPFSTEHIGLQLDADLDVLAVPKVLPALILPLDPGLGLLKIVLKTLTRVEDMLLRLILTVGALPSWGTHFQVMNAVVLGLVRVNPDLLRIENKVDVEAFLVDQFLLWNNVSPDPTRFKQG